VTEQVLQSIGLALVKGEVWQGEVAGRRKDGRTYDAALTVAPVHDDEGRLTGYVSSHRDITRLKDLDRARSRFITNVSHQLRTPVTTIQLYTHLLRDEDMSEKAKQFSQAIKGEVTRLIHLIEDIIVLATLDSGQILDVWKPVPLPAVVESIVALYEDQAQASGLTLEAMSLPPDLPVVNGDHARLAQALGEVVDNAVKVETVEDEGRAWVTISVRDTGPGISPEEQEKVFDRFFRGSLAESGHVPGTGLGLSITQEVIRAHGGRVTVESELGQGSTFRLWLPAGEGEG
jgi:signal transduction histidine kinase